MMRRSGKLTGGSAVSGSVRGGTEPALQPLQRSYSTKRFTAAAAAAARCDVLYDNIHPAARAACPIICITTTHVGLRFTDDRVLAAHIPIHYGGKSEMERSAKRDMHSRDGARSAIGMGHSS